MAVEGVDRFEWESDSYLDASEVAAYEDIGRTCR